ncbi:hypothetical protein C8P63_10169 [Melghirimyces profundicolus]|uniref:Uncharacterized protein n=1 Tax=Melghirimyces profundicolus TaxID=1242148 RepID=A0A2T6C979_9BACL|nr:hypothetical protein [Melghirimyces profundicolus]PTX64851.1 hypothetical protein C8P63_10169 [Melghirimyces profundicolus]
MGSMEDWESALDDIDWNDVLEEVDGELLENLARELRFGTYEALRKSSRPLGDGFQITRLSDGNWAFWNEQTYVQEDIRYFDTVQHFLHFALEQFNLGEEEVRELIQLLDQTPRLKRCAVCDLHFNPEDEARRELGIEGIYLDEENQEGECCSPQCAVEAVLHEMKEG